MHEAAPHPNRRRKVAAAIGGAVCAGLALASQYLLMQPEYSYTSQTTEAPVEHSGPALAAIEGLALGGVFLAYELGKDRPAPVDHRVEDESIGA